MLVQVLLFITSVALTSCDVSHLETTTELLPPRPYAFSYTAGRYPGDIDRQHAEVSDGSGVVKGESYPPMETIQITHSCLQKECTASIFVAKQFVIL